MEESGNLRRLARVIGAYAEVFGWLGNSTGYLVWLSAGSLSGLTDYLAFTFLGSITATIIVVLVAALVFYFAARMSAFLFGMPTRFSGRLDNGSGKSISKWMAILWGGSIAISYSLSFVFLDPGYAYAVALNIALGAGNISTSAMLYHYIKKRSTLVPMAAGIYLVAVVPVYHLAYLLPGSEGGYIVFALVLFNIIASYFATAVYYLFGALKASRGILDEGH